MHPILSSLLLLSLAQPVSGDMRMDNYLAAECDRLSAKFLDGARTANEWNARRPKLVREYYDMLGLWPLPEKTPLHAVITRTIESQGTVIECLHFQSMPGLYVTANFYKPKGNTKRLPTILYVCGHSNKGRDGNKSAYQDHGLWFANNGYNCLIVDTVELGEIKGEHHGTYGLRQDAVKGQPTPTRMWWHSAGYTPAGVECWNGVRAIDYLETRPDVDAGKIGVTGISGGGAATFWIAAGDDRVKVAVPVSGMSDLEEYVKDRIIDGHCDCMFFYNTYQWDWSTIAALIAPRPFLFANSDADTIFPMAGNRRISEKMRKLYKLVGAPEKFDDYVSVGGHAYRPDLRVAVFQFLNKHLKGDAKTPVADAKFETIPGKDLRVWPTDADIPKDARNARIDETFVPRGKLTLPEAKDFKAWQKKAIEEVRQRAFRPFPFVVPPAGYASEDDSLVVRSRLRDTMLRDTIVLPPTPVDDKSPLLVCLDTPTSPERKIEWLRRENPAHEMVLISPTGDSAFPWTKKSPPNRIERSHLLLGQTVDQQKVYDFLSAVKYLKGDWSLKRLRVGGSGRDGILAAYAALLDPTIAEVVLVLPPTSHMQGPHFPGILRTVDIPEALGLLAPRPLTIVGDDPAFDRTAEIYRLAGAAEKLRRLPKE
ncbi:MAG TPA: CocE/NonD family hydrolase [Gemmataceae bacterium]|jgi:cephalosporin-C deacetylase-like acetyl esterase|nr:CocE/NonD family hydrolase [Gemmataceae bacterium]